MAPFDVTLNRDRGEKNVVQPDFLVICDKDKVVDENKYEGNLPW